LYQANPNGFEINEFDRINLCSPGSRQRRNPYLAKAVRLNPDLPDARTTLAANLVGCTE